MIKKIIFALLISMFCCGATWSPMIQCSQYTAGTGGWVYPAKALTDGNGFAYELEKGENNSEIYSDWGNHAISENATIVGIEILTDDWHFACNNWGLIGIEVTNDATGGSPTWSDEEKHGITTSETTYTSGGSTDLWGLSGWDAGDFNGLDFQVQLYARGCVVEGSYVAKLEYQSFLIDDIQVGDYILGRESGYNVYTEILDKRESTASSYLCINCDIAKGLKVTTEHPIYIDGEYKRADELQIGDVMLGFDGQEYPVETIETIHEEVTVYDLTTTTGNFYAQGILTHNKGELTCNPLEFWDWRTDWIRAKVYYTAPNVNFNDAVIYNIELTPSAAK